MKALILFILANILCLCTPAVAPPPDYNAVLQGVPFPGVYDFSVTSSSGRVFNINAYDNGNSIL